MNFFINRCILQTFSSVIFILGCFLNFYFFVFGVVLLLMNGVLELAATNFCCLQLILWQHLSLLCFSKSHIFPVDIFMLFSP